MGLVAFLKNKVDGEIPGFSCYEKNGLVADMNDRGRC
jgi:hypothetical protein